MTIREILDYIRTDHIWLYEIIADKTMVLARQAHWKRREPIEWSPDQIGCAEIPARGNDNGVDTTNG